MKTLMTALLIMLALGVASLNRMALGDQTTNEIPGTADVRYYAHLTFRETPFADPRGVYPISAELTKTYKHYRIVYDVSGRPVEISFRQGDEIQPLNISSNRLTFTPVIRIAYEDGKEVRTFFDRFMNPTTANGVFREVYDLDDFGNRSALRFYDYEGIAIESNWGIGRYEWTIERNGTVTEVRLNAEGEMMELRPHFPFYCLKLHYDHRGLLAMMENYGETCTRLTQNTLNAAQDKLEYNAMAHIYAWNVYDENQQRSVGNGPMVARGIMDRDEKGYTIRQYFEDQNGNRMTNSYGWTNSISEFDEHGNMVRRYNYNPTGTHKQNNPIVGYSGYEMTYDESGRYRTLLQYFDEDDTPALHASRGYHAVKRANDEVGNVLEIRFEDKNGKLVNRTDTCVAVIVYTYDDLNRRSSITLLDANGKPARHCSEDWNKTIYHYHPNGPLSHTERQ